MAVHTKSVPVAIAAAMRTPIGRFGGHFKHVIAPELASCAIQACLDRCAMSHEDIDQVILGNVLQAGAGPNPARRASVLAGLPYSTPAYTVNQVCGSGMKAIEIAAGIIRAGNASVIAVGGMESMSSAPYLLSDLRWGRRLGSSRQEDCILKDALWDCFYDCHMGSTAERLAAEYSISRETQDEFASRSQQRYAAAQELGLWNAEIAPMLVRQDSGEKLKVELDESPRPQVTPESLRKLPSAFVDEGTVSAGNSSSINDGAAALILMSEAECERRNLRPLGWIGAAATVGLDPMRMGIGPALAIHRLLEAADCAMSDCDLLEINEAFAAQVLAVCSEMTFEQHDRLNVNGGAIAMGHPIGASGARIVVSLVHELARRKSRRGIAATCIGGGMGIAMEIISR